MADRHITSCYENAELGYVKIFRSMLNWEWYKNPYVTRVFLHFLLCATSKNYCKNANVLKQGSFWTTRRHVARALDISEYQVRKAIKKLVSTNEIANINFFAPFPFFKSVPCCKIHLSAPFFTFLQNKKGNPAFCKIAQTVGYVYKRASPQFACVRVTRCSVSYTPVV